MTVVATFISVACATGAIVSSVLRRSAPERKRIRDLVQTVRVEQRLTPVGLTDEPNRLAEKICRVMPRSDKRMREMRLRLVHAGYRSIVAPVVYAASQIVLAIVVGVVVLATTR